MIYVPPEHPQYLFAILAGLIVLAGVLIWRHGDYPERRDD